jgi:hypothetical protein
MEATDIQKFKDLEDENRWLPTGVWKAGHCFALLWAASIKNKHSNPIRKDNLVRLGRTYWWVVGLRVVFYPTVFLYTQQMDITLVALLLHW